MSHPNAIIVCARSWIGTRFHHQGRLKKTSAHKGGVDCLGLLVGVADELSLTGRDSLPLVQADETHYSHQPDNIRLRKRLSELLTGVPKSCMSYGDIVLLNVDDQPQHLGIISDFQDGFGIIHAYAPAKAVVEHTLDGWWIERIEAVFRVYFSASSSGGRVIFTGESYLLSAPAAESIAQPTPPPSTILPNVAPADPE